MLWEARKSLTCILRSKTLLKTTKNRSVEDAVSHHYIRLLFIDCSAAFNTIMPTKLGFKLRDLGLGLSICALVYDFLSGRHQTVRLGKTHSSTLILNTGTPQGFCLSPLLYSFTVSKCHNNKIVKFADDTTAIDLIHDNDEDAYRMEVQIKLKKLSLISGRKMSTSTLNHRRYTCWNY